MSTIQSITTSFQQATKQKQGQKTVITWLKGEIWKLVKERDSTLKGIKSKLVVHRHRFVMLRNKVTKGIRKAKANFFIKIISKAKGNAK